MERDERQARALLHLGWFSQAQLTALWQRPERHDARDFVDYLCRSGLLDAARSAQLRARLEAGTAGSMPPASSAPVEPTDVTSFALDSSRASPDRAPRSPTYGGLMTRGMEPVTPAPGPLGGVSSEARTIAASNPATPFPSPMLGAVPTPFPRPVSSVPMSPGAATPTATGSASRSASRLSREVPGSRLDGSERWEERGPLGEGGMGIVKRVFDLKLKREVALKVVRGELCHKDVLARFEREVQLTARLQHPGVAPVYDAGASEGGQPWLVMRLVEGETLGQRLKSLVRRGSVQRARQQLLEVMLKVSETVAFGHSEGVVHRDLKPSNIMIGDYGEVFVMDWGISLDLRDDQARQDALFRAGMNRSGEEAKTGALTVAGSILGTPGYMSPEQADGAAVGALSDVYALGAILSELLSGRPSLDAGSGQNWLVATLRGYAKRPRQLDRAVPRDLDALCDRCLEVSLKRRLPSAEALCQELRRALAGELLESYDYPRSERLAKAFRRRAGLFVAVALVGLVLLLVSVTALVQVEAARASAEESARAARVERARVEGALAETERARAETEAARARAESTLAEVTRLSDIERARTLRAEGDRLWPISRSKVSEMQEWLERVASLIERAAAHRQAQSELIAEIAKGGQTEAEAVTLRWRRDLFAELIVDLERLVVQQASVERRLEGARVIWKRSVEAYTERWRRTREEVADQRRSPAYGSLELSPQEGLVPLGRDPATGLQEFALLETGELPRRGPNGRLELDDRSGAVLVLLPTGRFAMGSDGRRGAVSREVVIRRPFFIGKHELSQGQWLRVMGHNPSAVQAQDEPERTLSHPVEMVSWSDAWNFLQRYGCRLPSEAEWEYACRAGTTTRWWTGASIASLEGAVNGHDETSRQNPRYQRVGLPWHDGFAFTAPIGSFRANAFGLHDTMGNVWEWCQDDHHPGPFADPGTEAAYGDGSASHIVFHGGAFQDTAESLAPGARFGYPRKMPDVKGGFRVARSVD